MRKRLLSGLFAIAAIGTLAPLAIGTAASQPTALLLADVDETTLSELALSYRILVNERVLDAYGHVSIRHPKNPNRFLMARSGEVAPAYVTANDIMGSISTAAQSTSGVARSTPSGSSMAKSTRCDPT